jgi:hypothetical protein
MASDILSKLGKTADGSVRYELRSLFWHVVKSDAGMFSDVLRSAIAGGRKGVWEQVTGLLGEAPDGFEMAETQLPLLRDMLIVSRSISKELHDRMLGALISSASGGIDSHVPGQPSPKYVDIAERCKKKLQELGPDDSAVDFFKRLLQSAEEHLEMQKKTDADLTL